MRIHFATLTIAILNSLFKKITYYSLEGNIQFGIEILIVITGLILFFFYLKPFNKLNYYFLIYATISFFLIIGLIFRGLFWGFVLSALLFPLIPDDKEFEENGIIISTPFQGIMAPCCAYQVKERQLFIFEKDYGIMELEGEGPIDFETMNVNKLEIEIILTYSTDFDKGVIKSKIIKR
jgi:hypothetical protein